jgi:hypothetical protein
VRKWRVLFGACAVMFVLVAALPADAKSPPGKELVRLRHQVAVPKAKVRRLQSENRVSSG